MVELTKKQEMKTRRDAYLARNAPWLIGVYCFLLGVFVTNGFYQMLLVGAPNWQNAFMTIGFAAMFGSLAYEAFRALQRREDSRG
jgi:hypothetical protein